MRAILSVAIATDSDVWSQALNDAANLRQPEAISVGDLVDMLEDKDSMNVEVLEIELVD